MMIDQLIITHTTDAPFPTDLVNVLHGPQSRGGGGLDPLQRLDKHRGHEEQLVQRRQQLILKDDQRQCLYGECVGWKNVSDLECAWEGLLDVQLHQYKTYCPKRPTAPSLKQVTPKL